MKLPTNKILRASITLFGVIILLFGLLLISGIGTGNMFSSLSNYYFGIFVTVLIVSGIGFILRKHWARLLLTTMLAVDIPRYIIGTKDMIKMLYTDKSIKTFYSFQGKLMEDILVDGIYNDIVSAVLYVSTLLIIIFFLLYPKVREQFK